MTTTLLEPNEVALFRSLKRTAIVLMLIYRLDKPVGRNEIASILDINKETAGEHLTSLARMGLITRTEYQNGYILTQGGRQLVLGNPRTNDGTKDLGKAQALRPGGSPGTSKTIEKTWTTPQALQKDVDGEYKESGFSRPFNKESDQDPTFSEKSRKNPDLLEEEEDQEEDLLIKSNSSSSNSSPRESEKSRPLKMTVLLAHSHLLFGSPGVIATRLPQTDPSIVLAWLAQAYSERANLAKPAAVAYCGIRDNGLPRAQYLENPEAYLPANYLKSIGLDVEETETVVIDADYAELEDAYHNEDDLDPSLTKMIGTHTPLAAWEMALGQLQMEMPRSTFKIVRDTHPIRYEDAGVLVVGAPTSYAREWLAGRLTGTIDRLLTGIFNRSVKVTFEEG